MADDRDWIVRCFEEGTPIDEAIIEAVRKARQEHKRAGNPVAEWRDGKVVWIAPEDIEEDVEMPHPCKP
jgi:hypothetical protein